VVNHNGIKNPYRNLNIPFLKAWMNYMKQRKMKQAREAYVYAKVVKRKEVIWDMTNELSRPMNRVK